MSQFFLGAICNHLILRGSDARYNRKNDGMCWSSKGGKLSDADARLSTAIVVLLKKRSLPKRSRFRTISAERVVTTVLPAEYKPLTDLLFTSAQPLNTSWSVSGSSPTLSGKNALVSNTASCVSGWRANHVICLAVVDPQIAARSPGIKPLKALCGD